MQIRVLESTTHHRQNSGFTLIELLITIGIIAALAGLLLAGVSAATSAVSTARCSNEISNLNTSLAQFHSEFGAYPPSQIVLYEDATGWNATDADTIRSKALIRKMWPNFNFGINRELDGDPSTDAGFQSEAHLLSGSECLVFFLGGPLDGQGAPRGFSKNPANPFSLGGSNRLGPFVEWDLSRMVDTDGDGMREYLDTYSGQQLPILYLSSYDGRGYRAAELPPGMTNVYRQTADPLGAAWKEKTFQLISPGIDGQYGTGGFFSESERGTISQADQDNITNFSSGKLK